MHVLNYSPSLVLYAVCIHNTRLLFSACCVLCKYSTPIIYNKPTRCNSVGIVFIKNYKYALHVSDALCVHLQEHYKL